MAIERHSGKGIRERLLLNWRKLVWDHNRSHRILYPCILRDVIDWGLLELSWIEWHLAIHGIV